MKLLVVAFLVSACLADPWAEFQHFKQEHGKAYINAKEENMRFAVFQENLNKIEKHNQEGHSWQLGVPKFADLSK